MNKTINYILKIFVLILFLPFLVIYLTVDKVDKYINLFWDNVMEPIKRFIDKITKTDLR